VKARLAPAVAAAEARPGLLTHRLLAQASALR
jgi:hypothetical protein